MEPGKAGASPESDCYVFAGESPGGCTAEMFGCIWRKTYRLAQPCTFTLGEKVQGSKKSSNFYVQDVRYAASAWTRRSGDVQDVLYAADAGKAMAASVCKSVSAFRQRRSCQSGKNLYHSGQQVVIELVVWAVAGCLEVVLLCHSNQRESTGNFVQVITEIL